MKINMITKTIYEIEYQEIDRIINEYYKPTSKFQFLADSESANDTSHRFRADGDVNAYDQEELEEFKKNNRGKLFMTQILLNDLCSKGEIPKGNYLIMVCW